VVLQEQLGSGNFGEVYKAIVTRVSAGPTLAAVKVLKGRIIGQTCLFTVIYTRLICDCKGHVDRDCRL